MSGFGRVSLGTGCAVPVAGNSVLLERGWSSALVCELSWSGRSFLRAADNACPESAFLSAGWSTRKLARAISWRSVVRFHPPQCLRARCPEPDRRGLPEKPESEPSIPPSGRGKAQYLACCVQHSAEVSPAIRHLFRRVPGSPPAGCSRARAVLFHGKRVLSVSGALFVFGPWPGANHPPSCAQPAALGHGRRLGFGKKHEGE